MTLRFLSLAIIFFSCGGSLTDEKRKELREKMEANKIVRVTEAEITEAAFEEGRQIVRELDSLEHDSISLRQYVDTRHGLVSFIKPGQTTSHLLEKQLIDAYLADPSGTFQDNVQEVRNAQGSFDTLLYTKPVTKRMADGRDQLIGVWNIWLLKKDLVREIGRNR